MNDPQLLALMATMRSIELKERPNDAMDKVEEMLLIVLERQSRHSKHVAAPDENCFHCRANNLARELTGRIRPVQSPIIGPS